MRYLEPRVRIEKFEEELFTEDNFDVKSTLPEEGPGFDEGDNDPFEGLY